MIRDNKNVIEGLSTSILKYTMNDLNAGADPEKAGSIEQKYSDDKQKENDLNYKIYNPDEFFNMMKLNKNFQEEKKPVEETKINFDKKYSGYSPSEYSPYENILPPMEFIKDSKVKDTSINIYERDTRQDLSYNTEKILGIADLDTKHDCKGRWSKWTESDDCDNPQNRCAIKFRTFNVIKEAEVELGGKECTFSGEILSDGEIQYEYCFGSGHKDRCGLEKNVCPCDIESGDCDYNEFETLETDCQCNKEENYNFSQATGKCISGSGISTLDIHNLTNDEYDKLMEIIRSYEDGGEGGPSAITADPGNIDLAEFLKITEVAAQLIAEDVRETELEVAEIIEADKHDK